jgi:hypothetical protein
MTEDPHQHPRVAEMRAILGREDLTDSQREVLARTLEAAEMELANETPVSVWAGALLELVSLFDASEDGPVNRAEPRFIVSWGWWVGINRQASAILALHNAGKGHDAAPIARALMECAYGMALVADASTTQLESLEHKTNQTLELMLTDASRGTFDLEPYEEFHEAFRIETADVGDWPLSFQGVVDRLGVFGDVYPPYRLLSLVSHGSLFQAINYLRLAEHSRIVRDPGLDLDSLAVSTAVEGVCLAGLAYQSISPGRLSYAERIQEISALMDLTLPTRAEGEDS